jgi:hypothetical protein
MNKKLKAGAVWVIGVSAPAVVTGIYKEDGNTRLRSYIVSRKSIDNERATHY